MNLRRLAFLGLGFSLILMGSVLYVLGSKETRILGIALVSLSSVSFTAIRSPKSTIHPVCTPSIVTQMNVVKSTWPVALGVSLFILVSFYLLHLDAVNGGADLAPVLLFSASAICGMAYFIYTWSRAIK